MRIKIDTNKKRVALWASGKEKRLFTLVTLFAGDAVIQNTSGGFFKNISRKLIDKIEIDLSHPSISKEFIQLLLRFEK